MTACKTIPNRILPVFVPHMGCPEQCVFCDQKRISGSPSSFAAERAETALAQARSSGLRALQLAYYGGSFTAIPLAQQERLLSLAQPYLADGTISSLRVSTRPDAVDETTLRRLAAAGVTVVELGAQSMDDGVLERCRRGHTAADTRRAAELVHAAGFSLVLQMMTGLPGSDRETDVRTARAIAALCPQAVRIYPTVIVRDTPLETLWRRGAYREHTVADAVAVCADILPLFEQRGIAVIRLGLNPTEELSAGGAVGGAYHPALGELVRGECLRRRAAEHLAAAALPGDCRIALCVPPRLLSALTGHGAGPLRALERTFARPVCAVADPSAEELVVRFLPV